MKPPLPIGGGSDLLANQSLSKSEPRAPASGERFFHSFLRAAFPRAVMNHQDIKATRREDFITCLVRVPLSLRLLASCCLCVLVAIASDGVKIGEKVADLRLLDATGHEHSLEGYQSSGKIVVLVFWSFKCPVTLVYDKRLAGLQQRFRGRAVLLAIDSNANESADEIQRNATKRDLPFPILIDREGLLADRLGATHTPSVYVVDGGSILRYRGVLDDNKQTGEGVRISNLENALEAILTGRPIIQGETRVSGCSIKRKAF